MIKKPTFGAAAIRQVIHRAAPWLWPELEVHLIAMRGRKSVYSDAVYPPGPISVYPRRWVVVVRIPLSLLEETVAVSSSAELVTNVAAIKLLCRRQVAAALRAFRRRRDEWPTPRSCQLMRASWRAARDRHERELIQELDAAQPIKPDVGNGGTSVAVERAEGVRMRDPIVKFFKDTSPGGNGAFAITTTAADPEEFLREAATALQGVTEHLRGDLEFTYTHLLPQICELWAKLRGYKAENVFERRLLIIGEPMPETHMMYLNDAPAFNPAAVGELDEEMSNTSAT